MAGRLSGTRPGMTKIEPVLNWLQAACADFFSSVVEDTSIIAPPGFEERSGWSNFSRHSGMRRLAQARNPLGRNDRVGMDSGLSAKWARSEMTAAPLIPLEKN
jgi:hypothetical protein